MDEDLTKARRAVVANIEDDCKWSVYGQAFKRAGNTSVQWLGEIATILGGFVREGLAKILTQVHDFPQTDFAYVDPRYEIFEEYCAHPIKSEGLLLGHGILPTKDQLVVLHGTGLHRYPILFNSHELKDERLVEIHTYSRRGLPHHDKGSPLEDRFYLESIEPLMASALFVPESNREYNLPFNEWFRHVACLRTVASRHYQREIAEQASALTGFPRMRIGVFNETYAKMMADYDGHAELRPGLEFKEGNGIIFPDGLFHLRTRTFSRVINADSLKLVRTTRDAPDLASKKYNTFNLITAEKALEALKNLI